MNAVLFSAIGGGMGVSMYLGYLNSKPKIYISKNVSESSNTWYTFHNFGNTIFIESFTINGENVLKYIQNMDVTTKTKARFYSNYESYLKATNNDHYLCPSNSKTPLLNLINRNLDDEDYEGIRNIRNKLLEASDNNSFTVCYRDRWGLFHQCQNIK